MRSVNRSALGHARLARPKDCAKRLATLDADLKALELQIREYRDGVSPANFEEWLGVIRRLQHQCETLTSVLQGQNCGEM